MAELPDWCSHDTIVKSKLGHVHICIQKIKLLASNSVHGANSIKYNIVDTHARARAHTRARARTRTHTHLYCGGPLLCGEFCPW